ncbi:MAG: hypothetical protein ACJ8LG_12880 [Massilia sp.]
MPIYTHNGALGVPVNIAGFVAATQAGVLAGPLPFLHGAGNNLGVHAAAFAPIGIAASITRAFGLITCASVIYTSTHAAAAAGAWVHHANAGHVAAVDVANAIAGLGGPPPASLLVIFAHPGASDPGYLASIATITGAGVPAANVVEIPNLVVPQFGINNLGWIG